jgi:hypothetical protein
MSPWIELIKFIDESLGPALLLAARRAFVQLSTRFKGDPVYENLCFECYRHSVVNFF